MKRAYLAVAMLLATLITPISISAQELWKGNTAPVNIPDFVTSSFINYYKAGGMHEKLYVITDKPFYSAGDTIYFSAFLVNSIYSNLSAD